MSKAAEYEAAHREADTAKKREWIRQEAERRGETGDELAGFVRSTYLNPPEARAAAGAPEEAPHDGRASGAPANL